MLILFALETSNLKKKNLKTFEFIISKSISMSHYFNKGNKSQVQMTTLAILLQLLQLLRSQSYCYFNLSSTHEQAIFQTSEKRKTWNLQKFEN